MSLYEEIGGISEKQITKTETGDNRIYGALIGIVTSNYDNAMPGRVCVSIPVRDKESNVLQWARVAQPSSGKNSGFYFQPEVEDQVILLFEGGNIEKPYVVGSIPKDNSKLVSSSANKENTTKKILTAGGNKIEFSDVEGKEKIEITTPENSHTIIIDKGSELMKFGDKAGDNQIEMKTKAGNMNINATGKIIIAAGDTKITINGSSGTVQIDAQKITLNSSGNIKLAASGNVSIEGAAVDIKASASLKLSSDAVTQVSGSIVKIG